MHSKPGSERGFGLLFSTVFALFALWPVLFGGAPRWIVLTLAFGFFLVAILAPARLATANRLWFKLGLFLGAFIAPIVMGLVFVIAVLPTGLVIRLMGRDPLTRKIDPSAKSYWVEREDTPQSMKFQF